ncbi:hypothetical protein F751_2327 [Auxenochlorella protothecoides]|uniref:Uncharacterized protein n=1 Tax=Auxenochlorella protothecoides TaxID=3075 RepID=A0A087SFV5_AUXPR|nr:hypothetical protein F751_2327 [Auxenochlorella protothecoides]KFM24609.1 hypothetical protein F751_2327 [Auxenochlorella protothecoides]
MSPSLSTASESESPPSPRSTGTFSESENSTSELDVWKSDVRKEQWVAAVFIGDRQRLVISRDFPDREAALSGMRRVLAAQGIPDPSRPLDPPGWTAGDGRPQPRLYGPQLFDLVAQMRHDQRAAVVVAHNEKLKAIQAAKRPEMLNSRRQYWEEKKEQHRALLAARREDELWIDPWKPCGFCPGCRLAPMLSGLARPRCERLRAARETGYSERQLVRWQMEGPREKAGPCATLFWRASPSGGGTSAGVELARHVRPLEHGLRALESVEEAAVAAVLRSEWGEEAGAERPGNLELHHGLVEAAQSAQARGALAGVRLLHGTSRGWRAAAEGTHDAGLCSLCRQHPPDTKSVSCPLLNEVTMATWDPTPAEDPGHPLHHEVHIPSFYLTGGMDEVCRPHHAPCPWLAETRPATQDLMGALQGVANAAVEDLERPDLQFRLSPHALHALGLILEEAALEELGSRLRI